MRATLLTALLLVTVAATPFGVAAPVTAGAEATEVLGAIREVRLAQTKAIAEPPSPSARLSIAQSIVTQCSQSDSEAVGLTELQEDCPGLEHALVELGYAPFISEDQLNALTVHSLVDLQQLTQRYRQSPQQAAITPDVAKLTPILHSLQQQQRAQVSASWLERFKKWVRELLDRPQQTSTPSWWSRWWEERQLPARWVDRIVFGLIALVLVLALVVVVNEIRARRIKGGVRRGAQGGDATRAPSSTQRILGSLADLDSVAPALRPALMLEVLVGALVNAGRLRADKSLTHRELSLRAAFDGPDQRDSFRSIAELGERLLYGAETIPAEKIDAMVATGRTLHAQLAAPQPSSLPPSERPRQRLEAGP